ncbi:hypothetical protein K8I61_04905 [bacterium]|nr:hypothetical protein [bacterium]
MLKAVAGRRLFVIPFFLVAILSLLVLSAAGCSCGDDDDDDDDDAVDDDTGDDDADDDTGADDDTSDDDADDDADDDGDFELRSDYLLLDGAAAPANPEGGSTPASLNKIPMFRFREDTGENPPREVDAILVLAAGYTAGANQLLYIAEQIVRTSGGDVEVWVLDRRFHLLEDLHGSNVGEEQGDPWLAYDYYYNGLELEGKSFGGYYDDQGPETAMLSEWGLDLQMADYKIVLSLVPEEVRDKLVFFAGHSRGAWFVQTYAAYEFEDGSLGKDDIAGMVLLDGTGRYNEAYDEDDYLADLADIRTGAKPRTTQFSFFTPPLYTYLEIFTMAAAEGLSDGTDPTLGPDGFFGELGPFTVLYPILTRFNDVQLTNEAIMGLVADDEFGPLDNFKGHMGTMTGGQICQDFLGKFPCEDGMTYSWLNYQESDPAELMDIQSLIQNIYKGPSNNADPYYSSRLDFDFFVADQMETEGTWRHDYFKLYTSEVDVPVYAMETALVAETGEMEKYRDRLPAVEGGTLPRDDNAFRILTLPDWEHIDGLQVDAAFNPVFPDLLVWILDWSEGSVQVPLFGTPWDQVKDLYPPAL